MWCCLTHCLTFFFVQAHSSAKALKTAQTFGDISISFPSFMYTAICELFQQLLSSLLRRLVAATTALTPLYVVFATARFVTILSDCKWFFVSAFFTSDNKGYIKKKKKTLDGHCSAGQLDQTLRILQSAHTNILRPMLNGGKWIFMSYSLYIW